MPIILGKVLVDGNTNFYVWTAKYCLFVKRNRAVEFSAHPHNGKIKKTSTKKKEVISMKMMVGKKKIGIKHQREKSGTALNS